jgi:hypothetical protein
MKPEKGGMMLSIKALKIHCFISSAMILIGYTGIFPQSNMIPSGRIAALQSVSTKNYVVSWDQGAVVDLHASALHADARSDIEIVDAGNGFVALRSIKADKFWTVDGTKNDLKVFCSSLDSSDAGLFWWISNQDGTVSLKSKSNNGFLSVAEEDTTIIPSYDSTLIAKYSTLGKQYAGLDGTSSLVITPDMLKPYIVKFYVVRARASSIGDREKFIVTSPALKKELAGERLSKVLTFMYSISGKKTISGVHNREPNSNPIQSTNRIYGSAGAYPALWGGDFLFESDNVANRGTMINEAKNEWTKGAVVNLMYHMCPPTLGESCDWSGGVQSSLSGDQWTQLITSGTALNSTFKQRLKNISAYFKTLKDAGVEVIFRPFHEMNQGAFWWGGRIGPTGTSRLFQIAHDYIVDTLGMTNVFFIWSVQDLGWNFQDYNPGDKYWDIFTLDFYNGDGFTTKKYNAMLDVAGTKLIGIAECATVPTAAELLAQPRWVYFSGWSELTTGDIKGAYTAANTLSRDEMPGWGNVIPTTQAIQKPVHPDIWARVEVTPRIVRFNIPQDGSVRITLHDANGRRVASLVNGEYAAGEHLASFAENAVSPGVYFLKTVAQNHESFQRVSILNF